MTKAFITGVNGPELSGEEAAFLAAERPAGLILFTRNCESREQISRLVATFKRCVGSDRVLVLIDQEGGRVQRLRPPLSRLLPPAAAYAALFGDDPVKACAWARLVARHTAEDLVALGIDTNCVPVLDVPVPGAHDIIGNRAYGTSLDQIIRLGRAVAEGFMAGGVLPVMKHIPGHGRATSDSHLELPVVTQSIEALCSTDFVPFAALSTLPAAMTAHIVYTALDATEPASTSRCVIAGIVRGRLGFDGLLMSDDLSMQALSGSLGARTSAVLGAGCDLALHCNGHLDEMREVAAATPLLDGMARQRFDRAVAVTHAPRKSYDVDAAERAIETLLSPQS
ncbi:MAG: beta-N-acetylhexosaminidase [Hyphomicrobiaceae bacterium]